ncbi:energy transducer TonB [Pendulispora brunnea]|uniref:Energy transducer TonB n=1 Tax=Pendulispora brunnea TaxID=2905690 RepID=A0ABZ2K736_9BACT
MNATLDRILARPATSHLRFGSVLFMALVSHLGIGMAAASLRRPVAIPLRETEIQVLPDEPPPPPPESPAPEKMATPSPAPHAPPAAAPPPAAAAAAKVMTAPDDAPVDLTGGIVVGSAETYAGGATAATGTGTRVGSPAGVPGSSAGTGPSSPPPLAPDLARPPRLAEGMSWNCPFPPEADEKGIDAAIVGLSIEVTADGDVANVTVERDPGAGFGRVAASCARSKHFSPAEDRYGKRVGGRSRVNVRFQR